MLPRDHREGNNPKSEAGLKFCKTEGEEGQQRWEWTERMSERQKRQGLTGVGCARDWCGKLTY